VAGVLTLGIVQDSDLIGTETRQWRRQLVPREKIIRESVHSELRHSTS